MNSTLFGALGIAETDSVYLNTMGAEVVYDAVAMSLDEHNAALRESLRFWVQQPPTPDYKFRYKPARGGGELQEVAPRSKAAEIKAPPGWDVALPIKNWGAGFAADRIAFAYMTARELANIVATVRNQDIAIVTRLALKALFNNTAQQFVDERKGTLTIQSLANQDGTIYPPLIGSDAAGQSNHYIGVAADATTITDNNNPIPAVVDKLEGHFGTPTGGSAIAVFCNNAQTNGILGLSGFTPVVNRYVVPGIANDRIDMAALPPLPGRILGECDGALVVEWRQIPAGYLLAIDLDQPAPLMERIDEPQANLPVGLALVSEDYRHPFHEYEWSHRFGFGVGNRLNGVVVDLTAAGGANSYTIPTKYTV